MIFSLFKKIKNYISKLLNKDFNINYLFFSFFFLIISFFSAFKTSILFAIFSTLQSLLLTIIFILIHYQGKSKILKKIFISISFLTILFYTANFILLGLMDSNLLFALNIFFSGGLENFLITFRALNINFTSTSIVLLAASLIPIIGILFYKLTNKLCQKRPFIIKQKYLFSIFIIALSLLIGIDLLCRFSNCNYISKNHHKLPLFSNFISHYKQKVILSDNLKPLRDETKLLAELDKKNIKLDHKPNIFIFVVEAFRGDYLSKEITSNIFAFKEENTFSDISFSAANATQISWYSIFHSNHPVFWSEANKTLKKGSIPLNILKKLGYKINVFTSAEMTYFHMDKLLFGEASYLVDNFNDFSNLSNNPSQRDKITIEALKKEINKEANRDSNVFLVFLDSTHSEYSWPENFKPKFSPYIDKINYLSLSQSKKDLDLVKNRYKNSLNYVDHLFNDFLSTLKNKNYYQNSIIVLTGDHGEEFFEEKSIFHASHLNDYQIKVPIIFKLLNTNQKLSKALTHIDIFPTILKDILPNENFDNFFDGKPIFFKDSSSYIISVNQKGNLTPNEFLIIKDNTKLKGKFYNYKTPSFDIDETKNIASENIDSTIKNALKDLIK